MRKREICNPSLLFFVTSHYKKSFSLFSRPKFSLDGEQIGDFAGDYQHLLLRRSGGGARQYQDDRQVRWYSSHIVQPSSIQDIPLLPIQESTSGMCLRRIKFSALAQALTSSLAQFPEAISRGWDEHEEGHQPSPGHVNFKQEEPEIPEGALLSFGQNHNAE